MSVRRVYTYPPLERPKVLPKRRAKHIEIRIDGPPGHKGNVYQVVVKDGARVIQRLIPASLQVCMAKTRELNKKQSNVAHIEYIGGPNGKVVG